MTLEEGDRVVVRTPDRREYLGRLVSLEERAGGRIFAVVRLDTGWLTSYPLLMVQALDQPQGPGGTITPPRSDRSSGPKSS